MLSWQCMGLSRRRLEGQWEVYTSREEMSQRRRWTCRSQQLMGGSGLASQGV